LGRSQGTCVIGARAARFVDQVDQQIKGGRNPWIARRLSAARFGAARIAVTGGDNDSRVYTAIGVKCGRFQLGELGDSRQHIHGNISA
jgi:hypothetical protein